MSLKNTAKKIASSFYQQVDSKIDAFLVLESKKYELANFQIVFGQPTDFKGQPQQEVKGGQFILSLTQLVEDSIYAWAKKSNSLKTGEIVFSTQSEGTVLKITFIDASCISLLQKVNAFSGLEIMLVVSPRQVVMNKVIHDNQWRDE